MRYRTTFLLLFAMLLAIAPLIQNNHAEMRCEEKNGVSNDDGFLSLFGFNATGGPNPCADMAPATPTWSRGLGLLSVACFGACLFSGFAGWRERRREGAMLRRAGIEIGEDELPHDD